MAKKVKRTISKSAKRGKKNHFCAIVIGLLVVISVVLAGLLYRLNVLPSGYIVIVVCALIVIVGLLSIGVLIKKSRIVCSILSLIYMLLCLFGIFYEVHTIGFLDNIGKNDNISTENYKLIVLKGSSYHDIKDLKNVQKVVLLENIKDSGNLGTILRSAVAFGADAVVLFGDCVDIYNPKTVRASVGNLWKLPIVQIKDIETFNKTFKNFNKIATLPRSKNLLKNYKINLPAVVMFGSEADGLTDELIKLSDDSVKIEMSPMVESLNLATSVSVILYELF